MLLLLKMFIMLCLVDRHHATLWKMIHGCGLEHATDRKMDNM